MVAALGVTETEAMVGPLGVEPVEELLPPHAARMTIRVVDRDSAVYRMAFRMG
jgi:hypothetical protein